MFNEKNIKNGNLNSILENGKYENPGLYNFAKGKFEFTLFEIHNIIKKNDSKEIIYEQISKYFDHTSFNEINEFQYHTKRKVSCKPSCSSCCYMLVTAYPIELDKYAKKILNKEITIDNKKLIAQNKISYFNSPEGVTYNEAFLMMDKWDNLDYENRACIFLNKENNKCNIYSERPIKCRQEFSLDDPKICSQRIILKGYPSLVATYSIDSHATNLFGAEYFAKGLYERLKKGNYTFEN